MRDGRLRAEQSEAENEENPLMILPENPTGRLVLVAEKTLSPASMTALRGLLVKFVKYPDVTMVSGLSKASVIEARAEGKAVFYNMSDHLSAEEACRLMPWREIWVVAGGRVWRAVGPLAA